MMREAISKSVLVFVFPLTIALSSGATLAEPRPVFEPNGKISGSLDGHAFELPVFCMSTSSIGLIVMSHVGSSHGSKSVGGVEPLVSIIAPKEGILDFVGFVGGKRFKFLRRKDPISSFPFSFSQTVRDREHGKVEAEFVLDCPKN